jgi:hypothetical protein
MSNSFLPDNYEAPKGGGGNYYKFQQGDNRFRILSKPIIGWLDWDSNNKPVRTPSNQPKPAPFNPAKAVKHFWAFIVWNYESSSLMVMEVTQAGIQSQIQALARDADWGSPFDYDIVVSKSGQDKETKYMVNPKPHKPITQDMEAAMLSSRIDLEQLFTGGDPFMGGQQA